MREHFISTSQHEQQMTQIQERVNQAAQLYDEAMDNSMRHYEEYILGDINLEELRTAQALTKKAASKLEVEKSALEKCEQVYQLFVRFRKVSDKELPLSEIVDEINTLTVDSGRRVTIQWV